MAETSPKLAWDCFISYARPDLESAQALHDRLAAAGFAVWFDRERLEPGCNWHQSIEHGCEESRIILPLIGPAWPKSTWTRFETYGHEAVIPLLLAEDSLQVMPAPLLDRQGLRLDPRNATELEWNRLFAAIRALLANPAPPRAARLANLRHRPPLHFVGRDDDLLHIHEALHRQPRAVLMQSNVHALSATGGVGKTTLADAYARHYWRLYRQIFWIDVRFGIENEFVRIHDRLFPDAANVDLSPADKARAVLDEFEGPISRLLVLDNVEDEDSAAAWLPRAGGCRTLVTSRFTAWSTSIESIPIAVLDPASARDFLLRRAARTADKTDLGACDALAKFLGFLPLALEQAGAYMAETGPRFGFDDCLRHYETWSERLLSRQVRGSTDYPHAVATTWAATIDRLGPEARAILRLASPLAATPIPISMFIKGAATVLELAATFGPVEALTPGGEELRMLDAVRELKRYSMAAGDGDILQVHNLVQTIEFQATGDGAANLLDSALALIGTDIPSDIFDPAGWPSADRLYPHLEAFHHKARRIPNRTCDGDAEFLLVLLNISRRRFHQAAPYTQDLLKALAANPDIEREARAHILAMVSVIDWATGRLQDAERHAIECLSLSENDEISTLLIRLQLLKQEPSAAEKLQELIKRRDGIETTDLQGLLADASLASLLRDIGSLDQAERFARRAVSGLETLYGKAHPFALTSVSVLGDILRRAGKSNDAEPLLLQAYEGLESLFGPDDPSLFQSFTTLTELLEVKADYAVAVRLSRQTLERHEATLGPEHLTTLAAAQYLAFYIWPTGNLEETEHLLRRVLTGREAVLGRSHPDTLFTVSALGHLLAGKNELDAAEIFSRRALSEREATLGSGHPDTLASAHNLGVLFRRQGKFDDAETLLRRALAGREAKLGPDHRSTLDTVNSLGVLLSFKGERGEAERLHRRAMDAQERLLGPDHPETSMSVNNLASELQKRGAYEEAEVLHRRAYASRVAKIGHAHPNTLISLHNLASVLQDKGDLPAAEPLYRQALAGRETHLGATHPDTLTTKNALGNLYYSQNRLDLAEPLYRETLTARNATLGSSHLDTLVSVNNLASLLYQKGDLIEAESLYRQALAARETALGTDHADTLLSLQGVAHVLYDLRKFTDALGNYKTLAERRERLLGPLHNDTLAAITAVANSHYGNSNFNAAEPLYRHVLACREETLGIAHQDTLSSVNNLANLLCATRDDYVADALYRRALRDREDSLGYTHRDTMHSLRDYVTFLIVRRQYDLAENLLWRAVDVQREAFGPADSSTLTSINQLISVLFRADKQPQALSLFERSLAEAESILGQGHPLLAELVNNGSWVRRWMSGQRF